MNTSTTSKLDAPAPIRSSDLLSATVKIEETLNLLPEVTWDRWTGEIGGEYGVCVFGWIPRDDGKSDFVFVRIDDDGCWMYGTSSAKYSEEFGRRLKFDGSNGHDPCKRVEDAFLNVKAVKISKAPNEKSCDGGAKDSERKTTNET